MNVSFVVDRQNGINMQTGPAKNNLVGWCVIVNLLSSRINQKLRKWELWYCFKNGAPTGGWIRSLGWRIRGNASVSLPLYPLWTELHCAISIQRLRTITRVIVTWTHSLTMVTIQQYSSRVETSCLGVDVDVFVSDTGRSAASCLLAVAW